MSTASAPSRPQVGHNSASFSSFKSSGLPFCALPLPSSMEPSPFSQLHDAWFLSQLSTPSPTESTSDSMYTFSYSSISPPSSHENFEPPALDDDHTSNWSCSELAAKVKISSSRMPSAQNSGFLAADGPSSLDIEAVLLHQSSRREDDVGNSGIAPFEEDVLMDPVLDYINEILMEEEMEDLTCMQQDRVAYQAIVNGFYDIIGEHCPHSSSADSSEDSPQQRLSEDNKILMIRLVGDDENARWIDEVLNSNPSTPLPASSNSKSQMANAKEDQVKPWVNESCANFQDDGDGSDAAVVSQPQEGNGCIQLPPIVNGDGDVSFVNLKVEADYTNLYVGKGSPERSLAKDMKGSGVIISANGKKNSAVGNFKTKGKRSISNGDVDKGIHFDLRELLVSCAQAVAWGNVRKANEVLQELRQHGVSPNGTALQRVAHYFSEALMARLYGTGSLLYTSISSNPPSAAKLLKATKLVYEVCPYMALVHYFANQSILQAAQGASRLHVVDYGILYGMQWPCLINALADRKGGPPTLVITGIELPQPGLNPAQRVEDTGRRLAEYARTYKVPFEYHAIAASQWEDVEPDSLHLRRDEVLVVACIKRLRNLLDESVAALSPRQMLLSRIRSLNPKLFVTAVVSAAYNSAFFVSRFREALYSYYSFFDMLDTISWDESPERMTLERFCLCRNILNIVACEGVERVERAETYKQWQARIQRAGFEQLPLIPTILSRARSHVKNQYHKDFSVHHDSNQWMLLGWKGRTYLAASAWKSMIPS